MAPSRVVYLLQIEKHGNLEVIIISKRLQQKTLGIQEHQ